MILDMRAYLVQPFAGLVVEHDQRDAAVGVGLLQGIGSRQIRLGDDKYRLHILVYGRCGQLIQHQCAGHRLHRAGNDKQHIQVGDGRADKNIFAGQDLLNGRTVCRQAYLIARHRGDAPLAEHAAGLTLHDAVGRFYIVKAADALCDISFHVRLRQLSSEDHQSVSGVWEGSPLPAVPCSPLAVVLEEEEDEPELRKYGMMRKKYLEENQFLLYERMAMNGTLFPEMRKVDEAADRIKKQMLPKLAQEAGATDELKRTDQFEWVRRMEACNHQVEEVILAELVYS